MNISTSWTLAKRSPTVKWTYTYDLSTLWHQILSAGPGDIPWEALLSCFSAAFLGRFLEAIKTCVYFGLWESIDSEIYHLYEARGQTLILHPNNTVFLTAGFPLLLMD